MRWMTLFSIILSLALMLCGCSPSREVENQAYALVMGLDHADDGALEMTIRAPKVGRTQDGESGGRSDDDAYLVFSARGESLARVLEGMQLAVPRELNLSHIKLLIVSEALAREQRFPKLIDQLAEVPSLYTNARFVVCEGSAKAFVEAQKTVIGTRLSAEIDAKLTHYADHGFIPDGSFASVYYATHSIYSDPVAAWGTLVPEGGDQTASVEPLEGGDAEIASPSGLTYAGAAIFRDGVLAGKLDAAETMLLNLILGRRESVDIEVDGEGYALMPAGSPAIRVSADEDGVHIDLSVRLTSVETIGEPQARTVERRLEAALYRLIRRCQDGFCEPFGFAERAAGHFSDVPSWLAYRWRERFAAANVDVRVALEDMGVK